MSKTSPIFTVAEWVSPYSGVVVDFYRENSFQTYHNPSADSMGRLAHLVGSNRDTIKVIPWATGGIVGWYADVQRRPATQAPL